MIIEQKKENYIVVPFFKFQTKSLLNYDILKKTLRNHKVLQI